MTEKEKIPWKRISIEASAIVGSILLAFAIDAWWDERRDRIDERNYLVSLKQEYAESFEFARQSIRIRHRTIEAHEALVAQIQGETRATDRELYVWFSSVSYPVQYLPPRSVSNDLVASGSMILIRSSQLRLALAEFEQRLRHLEGVDENGWAVWEGRIQPLLEGRVPRVERLRQGLRATLNDDVPFGESSHRPDFNGVLSDPRLEDMLAERWLRLQNGLVNIERLSTYAEEIVRLIDSELQLE